MDTRKFAKANRERSEAVDGFNHRLEDWSMSDWFLAVFGELGEAANIGKKLNRVRDGIRGNKQTPKRLRARLRQEIADAYIYMDLLCQREGFDLGEAVIEVFNKKSVVLGYPKTYSEGDL